MKGGLLEKGQAIEGMGFGAFCQTKFEKLLD
jgi:hypothetical protein